MSRSFNRCNSGRRPQKGMKGNVASIQKKRVIEISVKEDATHIETDNTNGIILAYVKPCAAIFVECEKVNGE